MGIMICSVHGRVSFVEACKHVVDQVDNGECPVGHSFRILGSLFLCNECFERLGYVKLISLDELSLEQQVYLTDGRMEAAEFAYNLIEGRRAICVHCLSNLKDRSYTSSTSSSRSRSNDDPGIVSD